MTSLSYHPTPRNVLLVAMVIIVSWTTPGTSQEMCLNCCINMPRPPLHGSLRYVDGNLLAEIKCPEGKDLPANAPGDGGWMSCSPDPRGDNDNFDNFIPPTCLPYEKPIGLTMEFVISYVNDTCPSMEDEDDYSNAVAVTQELVKIIPSHCSSISDLKCLWRNHYVDCAENFNNPNEGAVQFDVSVNMVLSEYNETMSIDFYNDLSDEIRQTVYGNKSNLIIPGLKFMGIIIDDSWTALCNEERPAIGTELAWHLVSSCRGCPMNYIKFGNGCDQCPPLTYTRYKAFASKCYDCPDKSKWDDIKLYEKHCLRRV